jgi:hypothetical protein
MHPFSFCVSFLSILSPLVLCAPLSRRAPEDILVFKFADVLEQLEAEFYKQALAKFVEGDFTAAGFTSSAVAVEQFTRIQSDEATHSVVLQGALKSFGEEPVTSCKFNFDSALTDVATMAATARVVEYVGIAAYSGAAPLLTDPVLLTSAASILTVEARHETILNILSGTGTAVSAPFDMAFTPSEVLALAGGFFDGPCDLGVPANPSLALTNSGVVGPGTPLTFSSPALNGSTDGLFCQMMVPGRSFSIPLPFNECVVPNINGPVALYITSDNQPLVNNPRDRATSQLIAGPALAFIDTQPETLGLLVRGGNGNQAVTTSTRLITPSEASSIIASQTATQAPAVTPTPAVVVGSTDAASSSSNPYTGGVSPGPSSGTTAPGPNQAVGPSADGSINVLGWTTS